MGNDAKITIPRAMANLIQLMMVMIDERPSLEVAAAVVAVDKLDVLLGHEAEVTKSAEAEEPTLTSHMPISGLADRPQERR
jgi:hypothetical protein